MLRFTLSNIHSYKRVYPNNQERFETYAFVNLRANLRATLRR